MRIGDLEIDVTALWFFESGGPPSVMEHRDCKKHFSKSASRYIYWELHLAQPVPPGRRISFTVTAVYYKADGSVLGKFTSDIQIEADWTQSCHFSGWGWKEAGNWPVGTVWVDLYIGTQKIASGSFEITAQPPHTTVTADSRKQSRVCPYCGADAVLVYTEDFFWECQNCGQMGPCGDPMRYTLDVLPDEDIHAIFDD